jgi:hypothetical protein
MTIVTPDAQMMADFRTIGDRMIAEWIQRAGPDGQRLVDQFRERIPLTLRRALDALYAATGVLGALAVVFVCLLMLAQVAVASARPVAARRGRPHRLGLRFGGVPAARLHLQARRAGGVSGCGSTSSVRRCAAGPRSRR